MTEISSLDARMANLEAMLDSLVGTVVDSETSTEASKKRSRAQSLSDEGQKSNGTKNIHKKARLNDTATPVHVAAQAPFIEDWISSPESASGPAPWCSLDWKDVVHALVETDPDEVNDEELFELLISKGVLDRSHYVIEQPGPVKTSNTAPPWFRILHVVKCYRTGLDVSSIDEDTPFVDQSGHLGSKNRISADMALEDEDGLSFTILQDYRCCKPVGPKFEVAKDPEPDGERLYILSQELCDDLNNFLANCPDAIIYGTFRLETTIRSPQVWAYHCQKFRALCKMDAKEFSQTCLEKGYSAQFQNFVQYFRENKLAEFEIVCKSVLQRSIDSRYLDYILTPNTLLVHADKLPVRPERNRISQLQDWPTYTYGPLSDKTHGRQCLIVSVKLLWWEYSGKFRQHRFDYKIKLDIHLNSLVSIVNLPVQPLRGFSDYFRRIIEQRGRMFWLCRASHFVQYTGPDASYFNNLVRARIVVDFGTWRRSVADDPAGDKPDGNSHENSQVTDDLGDQAMAAAQPPSRTFMCLLPPIMTGFYLQEKKWVSLFTAFMTEVDWDMKAFQRVVIEENTRELMMALVKNQVNSTRTADIIEGKGNGLIILLHGGPGTGKTLTAESVAEHARKPLYRVTCGDIGTDAANVEKYLKEVLHLGKTWDCVVLLDEAEVFLQERSLTDLQRNALVAVFLRILEYYDGILILTSNRVGTFDEGFKSRIHLAIHYDKLGRASRKQIWLNFIDRLQGTTKAPVNIDDLREHLDDLSDFDLNGREIRNSMKLASSLASSKGKALDYECLKHVVDVGNKFNRYLKKLNENMSPSEVAKEFGLRNE